MESTFMSRKKPKVETPPSEDHDDRTLDYALARIRESLTGLRFGMVTLIVQDGVVVQIERTEKTRLRRT